MNSGPCPPWQPPRKNSRPYQPPQQHPPGCNNSHHGSHSTFTPIRHRPSHITIGSLHLYRGRQRSPGIVPSSVALLSSAFFCIAAFWGADDPDGGYVVKCSDGTYSQSGGESGSCEIKDDGLEGFWLRNPCQPTEQYGACCIPLAPHQGWVRVSCFLISHHPAKQRGIFVPHVLTWVLHRS